METKKSDSRKHMPLLTNEEEGTLRNLIENLFYYRHRHDTIKIDLLGHNISQEQESKDIHRGFIFLSLLIQIILRYISEPLKKFGCRIERFLNRKIIPRNDEEKSINEDSEGFISFIGHVDKRTELDKNIKEGDVRYYPSLSMMAAKVAYENASFIQNTVSHIWKMEYVNFYDCYNEFLKEKTTQAFIMQAHNTENDKIIVAFRGTSPFDAKDWKTDSDLSRVKIEGMGKIHKGFMMALGLKKCFHEDEDKPEDFYGDWPKEIEHDDEYPLAYYTIREKLRILMAESKKAKIIITGHSLGGALAILFPAILALHGEVDMLDRLEAIYTFGQPRVGNGNFGDFMKNKLREHNIKYYRIVYGYDIVPKMPFDSSLTMFKHFGTSIHFNSLYHAKIVEEDQIKDNRNSDEKIKRYLKFLIGVKMEFGFARVIAVWQLIRGCIIRFTAGPDFREGWLLIGLRIIGILIPSIIDHNLQDYVNATRLASENLFRK